MNIFITKKEQYERLLTKNLFVQEMPQGDTWTRGSKRKVTIFLNYEGFLYNDERNDVIRFSAKGGDDVSLLKSLLKIMEG